MNIKELCALCKDAGRRPLAVTSGASGAVAVAGLEGRIYYVHNGEVVSLFRPESALKFSNGRNGYFNPGGDGLWAAPEGTCCGYQYGTGAWRVPVGLCSAQYEFTEQREDHLKMSAEVDLVNGRQLGVPTRFTREITVREEVGRTVLEQEDAIEYLGARTLQAGEFLLAPWSLSQFRVTPDARASFAEFPGTVRDLYDPSAEYLEARQGIVSLRPNDAHRIQLALPEAARFVMLTLPQEKLRITRTAKPLAAGLTGADIADAAPDAAPGAPVRYSIYGDPSGFMELEIVGGCRTPLTPGTRLAMGSTTVIESL